MFRNKHSPLSSSNISLYTDRLSLLLPLCPYNYSRLSTLEAYIFPDPSRCAIPDNRPHLLPKHCPS